MKLFYKVIVLAIVTLFLTGCKKGEDDPRFSFKTRKTRLEGNWRMTVGGAKYSEPGYNEEYTFDGYKYKAEVTTRRYYYFLEGNYSVNLKIDKNGKFRFDELIDTDVINSEGTWSFNTGVGEAKSKENVTFFIDQINKGFTGKHFFNRFKSVFVYSITELRDKKLVIRSDGKVYSSLSGNYATFSSHYTFVQ